MKGSELTREHIGATVNVFDQVGDVVAKDVVLRPWRGLRQAPWQVRDVGYEAPYEGRTRPIWLEDEVEVVTDA